MDDFPPLIGASHTPIKGPWYPPKGFVHALTASLGGRGAAAAPAALTAAPPRAAHGAQAPLDDDKAWPGLDMAVVESSDSGDGESARGEDAVGAETSSLSEGCTSASVCSPSASDTCASACESASSEDEGSGGSKGDRHDGDGRDSTNADSEAEVGNGVKEAEDAEEGHEPHADVDSEAEADTEDMEPAAAGGVLLQSRSGIGDESWVGGGGEDAVGAEHEQLADRREAEDEAGNDTTQPAASTSSQATGPYDRYRARAELWGAGAQAGLGGWLLLHPPVPRLSSRACAELELGSESSERVDFEFELLGPPRAPWGVLKCARNRTNGGRCGACGRGGQECVCLVCKSACVCGACPFMR